MLNKHLWKQTSLWFPENVFHIQISTVAFACLANNGFYFLEHHFDVSNGPNLKVKYYYDGH